MMTRSWRRSFHMAFLSVSGISVARSLKMNLAHRFPLRGSTPALFISTRTSHTATKAETPNTTQRRRRGAIKSSKFARGLKLTQQHMSVDDESSLLASGIITQYTINDTTCPPTDPDTLKKIVKKHITTLPKYWNTRPIAKHTAEAFDEALDFVIQHGKASGESSRTKVILDSGCGTGKSSYLLGDLYRDCVVIGVDQSLARLSRNKSYNQHNEEVNDDSNESEKSNVLLIRAEQSIFWQLCLSSSLWQDNAIITQHYMLYPNPYPKKSRLKSRFYANPAFPLLMMTLMMDEENGSDHANLVVRSNWKGFLQELNQAVNVWQEMGGSFTEFNPMIHDSENLAIWEPKAEPLAWEVHGPRPLDDDDTKPMTNFEAKYLEVGEPVYEVSFKRQS